MPESIVAAPSHLEVRSLSCERGERVLFRDLSFKVDGGELLQIEGTNGCGKTTLLRALCGLTNPAAGDILWRGMSLPKASARYLAELAFVGHTAGVKDDLSPRENLRIEAVLGVRRSADCVDAALQQLGLRRQADLSCHSLSAGQKRRVALGRLLVRKASIWLLDEPFTAIDRDGVEQLAGLIADHVGDNGLAIFTTHQAVKFPSVEPRHLRLGR